MSWSRSDHMGRLADAAVDVAVIGGGIVGAGVALDLAARGASVAVVERRDFASGTSSRSTKLLHGGIRYLPQLRFGMVREGLIEQHVLAETADYLYKDLDFVLPLYRGVSFGDLPAILGHHRIVPTGLRLGLFLYDRLGRRTKGHRRVGATEARELAPSLSPSGLKGAFVYRDAQTDDARLTVAVLGAAVDRGALAVNHAEVVGVARAAAGFRVSITDQLGQAGLELTATAVVAAAGSVEPPTPAATAPIRLTYSRGSHIITTRDDVGLGANAVVLPETEDDRILYMIPWLDHGLIGTTDVASDGDGGQPVPSSEEVDYLIRHVERYTGRRPRPITAFAGMRALAASGGGTARASRKEVVRQLAPGFFQVAGGKLTGYRVIAADVADSVARAISLDRKSETATIPIAGAGSPGGSGRLWDRYGTLATNVESIAGEDPGLSEAFDDGTIRAEVVHAVRHEGAVTVGDFALRRTRLSWLTTDHGRSAAPVVADLMATELGWPESRRAAELDAFEDELVLEGL